jgi:hypothetical protein
VFIGVHRRLKLGFSASCQELWRRGKPCGRARSRKDSLARMPAPLLFLFFFLDLHGIEVFVLEDLMAIQTFQVVDAISPGDDLGAGVLASGLHNND